MIARILFLTARLGVAAAGDCGELGMEVRCPGQVKVAHMCIQLQAAVESLV